jgi:hypothetical protein
VAAHCHDLEEVIAGQLEVVDGAMGQVMGGEISKPYLLTGIFFRPEGSVPYGDRSLIFSR